MGLENYDSCFKRLDWYGDEGGRMIKVLIVDDMIILRDCLSFAVGHDPELTVVGCASDGREAVQMSEKLSPDVILMDLNMPVYSGLSAIVDIKKNNPEIKILVLSTASDERNIAAAFRNGADGYVLKDIASQDLFVAIKKAFAGESFIHEFAYHLGNKTTAIPGSGAKDCPGEIELTDREKEVLELVVKGMTNEEIAENLGMSAGRARNIVADLISKYSVKNRTHLAVTAVTLQLRKEKGEKADAEQ